MMSGVARLRLWMRLHRLSAFFLQDELHAAGTLLVLPVFPRWHVPGQGNSNALNKHPPDEDPLPSSSLVICR